MDRLLEQVQSGDFDPIKEFAGNEDKFLEVKTAMESISNNIPKDVCIKFILTKIVPTIFDKKVDNTVRNGAIEIGLHFLKFANVSILTTREQEDVFSSIENHYAKTVGELRDSNYERWDKLWIFLIKLCSEKLHSKMSIANTLLRVVEVAFRNSTSIEQRLKAYDCWIQLIDNSSLNMDYMCSAKQIKLLVTPMKAKFSRMPVVIMKRCDTFVYLLEKLQHRATLCLKEFLEFCFGPFEEKNNPEKMKQGRSVPEVCNKSTRVLLEILGHSHESLDTCLVNEELNLYKPLIKNVNFPSFSEILINSVVQCCYLLNEWSQDSLINNTIIKCLWRSLLQFIHNCNHEVKIKCCTQINNSLRRLLERSQSNKYLHVVLGNIIDLLVQDDLIEKLKEVSFDISINLLHQVDNSCSLNLENVQKFVVSCFDPEKGSKFDKIASNSFKSNVKCENPTLCQVWLNCKIVLVPENISIFIWPVRHLQHFKELETVKSKWTKLYSSECKNESMKVSIMQEIEKIFLENPLLSSNIVNFLEVMSSVEANPSRDFVAKFMRLIELVLTLPNLSDNDVKKITSIVLTYCNQSQHFYKSENNDEALDKLCGCLEHLVTIHKDYTILSELTNRIKHSQPKNLAKFSKRLLTFLEALMLNEDLSIANNTRKLIELLETNEPATVSLTSRSMRLINMANPKPKKPTDPSNNSKSSFLSLKTSTTIPSPRGKNRIDSKKKKTLVIPISQDNSSDYVKIDSEVKINVENLNEHQLEMLKKRREDIPALYEDLTQSQSQDYFNSIGKVDKQENQKKRKRSNDDIIKIPICKIPKISDQPVLEKDVEKIPASIIESDGETQISDTIDPDLTEIFDDGVGPIQKEPPEELFEETPLKILQKVQTIPEDTIIEDKENQILTENDQTTNKDEGADHEIENLESTATEKSEDPNEIIIEQVEKKTSPRTPRKYSSRRLSESAPLRKSSRKTAGRGKERVSFSTKLLETSDVETGLDTDSNKIQHSIEEPNDETVHENEEEDRQKQANIEEEKTENTNENLSRKSKRQVSKRSSESIVTLQRAKKKPEEGKEDILSSQDEFQTKPNEKPTLIDNSIRKNSRKQRKEQIHRLSETEDSSDDNLSNGDLLDKIDKRIEDNKRLSADSNQNKIISLSKTGDVNSNQPTKMRTIKKAKRILNVPVIKTNIVAEEEETIILTAVNKIKTERTDVYEFKGEEESSVQTDEVKKRRKKKKSLALNRSDYISKRRKKIRKGIREEPFPFHVTADSPLPLSKSSTLRAVTPSSETITIVITRSPPDTPKNDEDSPQIDDTSPSSLLPPKKRNRSRRSPNTEDVVESSQTPVYVTKRKYNMKNRRSLKQTTIEEAIKPLIQSPSKRTTRNSNQDNDITTETETMEVDSDKKETKEENSRPLRVPNTRRRSLNELEPQKIQFGKRVQRSKSLDKINFTTEIIDFNSMKPTPEETETMDVKNNSPDTLTCDTKPLTGEADTLTCDTLTSGVEEEPNSENLKAETDGIFLSPVRSQNKDDVPTSPITCDTPDRIKELLSNTSDISPINMTPELSTPIPKATNEVPNVRVARLLQMVNSNVQVSSEGRRWFGNKHASPSSSRVKKMRMRKEENLDILTFSREVPSPLTVPASGILKRKFNLDETGLPSPKRKRVNFSDPAITQKKIFIKHSEEYEDQKTDSTNGSQILDFGEDSNEDVSNEEKIQELSSLFNREDALLNFRNFCDSNFKDINDNDVKSALKSLLQNLEVPEVLDVIVEFFANVNAEASDEIRTALTEGTTPQLIIDELIVPVVKNLIDFEEFLPTLLKLVEKLSDDKLETFISQIMKTKIEEKRMDNNTQDDAVTTEIEEHIISLDSDRMNDLIKKYFSRLENEQRNNFLIDLMSLASNELPVNKQFVNCHVNILQNFVKKMND